MFLIIQDRRKRKQKQTYKTEFDGHGYLVSLIFLHCQKRELMVAQVCLHFAHRTLI